jgi:hypothetical protein
MFTPTTPQRPRADLVIELEAAVRAGDREVIGSADRDPAHVHGPEPER